MVQERGPLHLLLRQRRMVRTGGDDQRRGGAPEIPRNLRQRVYVLQGALEHPRNFSLSVPSVPRWQKRIGGADGT